MVSFVRVAFLLWVLLVGFSAFLPCALAEGDSKVVRVGWHESPYNIFDAHGGRSGYSYEYERKIAAYTGWKYEYVEASWSELFAMLKAGEIDLLGDVSYSEDRVDEMLFSSLPMGTESYYLFVAPGNEEITIDNLSALNGKRVGANRGSIQKELFLNWAKTHNIKVEFVDLDGSETNSQELLRRGELDAIVTMDIFGGPETMTPVAKIGFSNIYFAVNKDRTDLLGDLDAAMSHIQDENSYYNLQLHEKYLANGAAGKYLSGAEKDWLEAHGPIRIGYQDDYLAFCASNDHGKLTGALKDYLEFSSTCLENARLSFTTTAYPSAEEAMQALERGEIDCMFPANLSDYEAESRGVVISEPIMTSEMDAVVRAADQREFIKKQDVRVAVNKGNTNYELFLKDHYPDWQPVYFPDTPLGLKAVSEMKADCVIISNYRYNSISDLCERLGLATVYTGVDMDYNFALREGDTELYSIIAKVEALVPDTTIHAALAYYSAEEARLDVGEVIRENLLFIMTVIIVILAIILILLTRSIRAERRAHDEETRANELNRKVFVDPLTSVRNRAAYINYLDDLQTRLDNGDLDAFAVGVFDCDNLKHINDQYGHDCGDIYIKSACRLICTVYQHSPVFRIGGDEFTAVLMGSDLEKRNELATIFRTERDKRCADAKNVWEEPHVSSGIALYNPQDDDSVDAVVRHADKLMYEDKRNNKVGRA